MEFTYAYLIKIDIKFQSMPMKFCQNEHLAPLDSSTRYHLIDNHFTNHYI